MSTCNNTSARRHVCEENKRSTYKFQRTSLTSMQGARGSEVEAVCQFVVCVCVCVCVVCVCVCVCVRVCARVCVYLLAVFLLQNLRLSLMPLLLVASTREIGPYHIWQYKGHR